MLRKHDSAIEGAKPSVESLNSRMEIFDMFPSVSALRKRLLYAAAIAVTSMPAMAQQPPAAAATPDATLEEVIVTGSRIAAPNEVSTSPIVAISSKSIETTGKTDISDLIMQLPQNFNNSLGQDLGNTSSGLTTAGGIATADLRGLGPNRTLVLVDGIRLGQGSPYTFIQSPAPDLDQIPAGLVDRIEVVTGGASAAYGSDAIAGVINFIMKKNFQGIQIDGQFNENYHDNGDTYMQNLVRGFGTTPATGTSQDGRQRSFDVLMGTNFADGDGNITSYLSWRHADPVASSQRDYGGCELYPTLGTGAQSKTVVGSHCDGSANSNLWQPNTGPQAGNDFSVLGNSFVPFGTAGTNPPAAFNSQPYIFMTREDDRANAAVLGHLKVTDYFQPYADLYFMDDRTHQQVAPAAAFFGANPFDPTLTGGYPVTCNNPFMSAQQQSTLCSPAQITAANANPTAGCILAPGGAAFTNCSDVLIGRRNVEGLGRSSDYEHENYRAVLGTKGEILPNGALSYDLYGQYFYTAFNSNNLNYFNFQGIDNSLQAYNNGGTAACVSGSPCVPWNIFKDGGVTQSALNYLYVNGTGIGNSTLRTEHGELTSQLGTWGITSPFAHDGIAVNAGFEHRNDHEFFQPDNAELTGILSGFGSAATPVDEGLAVTEGFTEIRAPLVQDMPFAKELLFDTGYRYSSYDSNNGATDIKFEAHTYKFEVQYAPIQDVRLRVSYDKAIRAPSIIELYNPQLVGLIQSGSDPCAPQPKTAPGTPLPYSQAQCANLGVSAAQYAASTAQTAVGGVNPIPQCIAGQCSQLTGGNSALKPEQGETYTIGINFSPSFLPTFTASIDYYHIAIRNEVNVLPASNILSGCANTGNPVLCSAVVRAPANGGLQGSSLGTGGYIVQTDLNLSSVLNSGIDLQAAYRQELPPGFGNLQFEMNGNWLQHNFTTLVPGGPGYECAGLFGFTCQTVNPRWHHNFRTTWNTPWDVSAALTWRYIGGVRQDADTGNPLLKNPNYAYDAYNASIPSFSYLDMEVTWHPTKILTVRAGANNILDKDPPLLVSQAGVVAGGAANTADAYDIFGRQLFVAFSAKF
jgi:iron complex outermembrane recepter protein